MIKAIKQLRGMAVTASSSSSSSSSSSLRGGGVVGVHQGILLNVVKNIFPDHGMYGVFLQTSL